MQDIHCWESKFEPCSYSNRLLPKLEALNKVNSPKVDITEVKKAIYYARKYHGSQQRQTGEPYYSHPIEVAYLLADYVAYNISRYYRTDLLVTAVLHDTLEDTILTEDMIEAIFGKNIAYQVERLTRVKLHGKISAAEIIKILFEKKENDLLMVKLFDRLHNMQTLGRMSPEKTKKITEETLTRFISLSMYLNARPIEQDLIKLLDWYWFHETPAQEAYSLNSFQLPSLSSRSRISPIHSLSPWESK